MVTTTSSFAFKDVLSEEEINSHVEILHKHGLALILEDWLYDSIQEHIRENIAPVFWKYFETEILDGCAIDYLTRAFDKLCQDFSLIWPCLDRLLNIQEYIALLSNVDKSLICKYSDPIAEIHLFIKAIIFHVGNKAFNQAINQFYIQCFKAFDASTKGNLDLDDSNEDDSESLLCNGCDLEKECCNCEQILHQFHHLNATLKELGLLERISGDAVSTLINQRIKRHIEHTCKGNFEIQYIQNLEDWLDVKVVGWLDLIYNKAGNPTQTSTPSEFSNELTPVQKIHKVKNPVSAQRGRLFHYMYEIYAFIRIQQLFNIIIEYPESEPALLDLKSCLEKTNLRSELVKSLKAALETRLLHPGVNTSDILTAYISAIKALRVLDPAGVLLDLVCEPVRKYLRNREDTVRCIVSSLTEEGNSELSDELIKGEPLMLDESYCSDEDAEDWENWMPDPVDADPAKSSSSRRSSDIISMLVNIYGSKELFVNEYRTLLADRILTQFNYDTEKEIRYLELLKMRFGEAQLHFCEVMLKDVSDSKRLNSNISDARDKEIQNGTLTVSEKDIAVKGMVLSAQFWPAFREEKLELPEHMKTCLEKYTESYSALKGNRTLMWKPHLGLVDIELALKDRILNLKVTPTHAAIIWYFQEKEKWSIEDLGAQLQMPAAALRRKMAYWQSQGVLREEANDVFVLLEEQRAGVATVNLGMEEEEETESAMASAQDQKEEEFQVIWQYIVGMLTNLESLPIDRIHYMLKMFAMTGPGAECTVHELKGFLDKKVKEQKLVFASGVYRLAKPT